MPIAAPVVQVLLFVLLAGLSAAAVRRMVFAGVLDRPNERSSHDRPIPKGGGVGVVAAVAAGAAVRGLTGQEVFAPVVLLAAVALAGVALADDARSFSFAVKLGAQLAAASLAVLAGVQLREVGLPPWGPVTLDAWGVPITLAWIVFTTNAVNFIDGLNGLAAGASLLTAAVTAAFVPDPAVRAASWSLAAGLAGFLPFNFPRARIFMGDVGSQFCGFLLATLSVAAVNAGAPLLAGPLLLSGILFDVALTLCRRALARERIWAAHRGHLYQVAQRSGVRADRVAAVHWVFVLWGGFAVWLTAGSVWAVPLALAPQAAWVGYVVKRARSAGLGRW